MPGDQLRDAVLAWWGGPGTRRDLPWRRTRDPWAVLVSEVMLQQTQVARVVPVYERFMARFPTVGACAAAPAGEVVRAWAGLGYNRRAVNLHRTATVVMDRHSGSLPADLPSLLSLPGIGPYTARAVLAFAFEADVAVVDTNVARVLARAVGRAGQAQADALVPPGQAWAWNSALLDLGATVCAAVSPCCDVCPVTSTCSWRAAGCAAPDPATKANQSAFAGSERQGRGRLVDALRRGRIRASEAAAAAGWPGQEERAARMVAGLIADGLVVTSADGVWLSLP